MTKIEITPQQMGHLLFDYVVEVTKIDLEDEENIKNLDIGKINPDHLFSEMIIINMFTIIQSLPGLLDTQEIEYKILDLMHQRYYKELIEKLNFSKGQIENEHAKVLSRYNEYQEAMKEENNLDNPLYPLAKHMLNNLHQKERRNFFEIMLMINSYVSMMTTLPEMISKYEIKK